MHFRDFGQGEGTFVQADVELAPKLLQLPAVPATPIAAPRAIATIAPRIAAALPKLTLPGSRPSAAQIAAFMRSRRPGIPRPVSATVPRTVPLVSAPATPSAEGPVATQRRIAAQAADTVAQAGDEVAALQAKPAAGGFVAPAAGAVGGFLVAGPIGALAGAAIGYFLGRKTAPAASTPPAASAQPWSKEEIEARLKSMPTY